MSTLSAKPKSRIASKGCAVAFAIAPVVVPIFHSPNRVRASVLFAFDNASVSSPAPDFGAYGPNLVFPSNVYSFSASQLPNGGMKIVGTFGPVDGSSVYASAPFDFAMNVGFYGTFAGDIIAGDLFTANVALNAAVTGGNLTFLGLKSSSSVGLGAQDLSSLPILGETFVDSISSDPAAADLLGASGTWSVNFGVRWSGQSANDTLTLTLPTGSLDVFVSPVPEPVGAAMLVLPAIVTLARRRTPSSASDT